MITKGTPKKIVFFVAVSIRIAMKAMNKSSVHQNAIATLSPTVEKGRDRRRIAVFDVPIKRESGVNFGVTPEVSA